MQVTVAYDYVLVLEWLGPDDRRTGSELHVRLLAAGVRSRLVVCNSGEEVRIILADALNSISTQGVPAIHLETHGTDPYEGDPRGIAFGAGDGPLISWDTLGEWLASLNEASGYRLLVVSGACWGSGVIAGMGAGEHPAPFACAIGFRTAVSEGRLFDVMTELYRSLHGGGELEESVASAQRELVAGQELHLEIAALLAIQILRKAYYGPPLVPRNRSIGQLRRRRRARAVWNRWFPTWLQEQQPIYHFNIAQIDV